MLLYVPMGGPQHDHVMSMDRLDPSGGYTEGNVVWCKMWINTAKGSHTMDEFKVLIEKLHSRFESQKVQL